MFGLAIWHWILVFIVLLLLFGRAGVSGLANQLGRGLAALKGNVGKMRRPDEQK